MSTNKSGLGAFASLGKKPPAKPLPPELAVGKETTPAAKSRAGGAGRKITIRNLTNEDLRRLNEFKYTHGTTIQDMAIEGLSLVLAKYGLRPLSAYGSKDRGDEAAGEGQAG